MEIEMPWLGNAIRIYSELQELCRKNCSNECGICRIRKKVNLRVHQLLKEDEFSEHCRTDEGSCLHFQEQIPFRKNEVVNKTCVTQEQK